MQTYTDHWVEALTGLAATGVEIILSLLSETVPFSLQSHPMIPLIQATQGHFLAHSSVGVRF